MPYGWLSILIVISLVFGANTFAVESVGMDFIVPEMTPETTSEQLQGGLAENKPQSTEFKHLQAAVDYYQSLVQAEQWLPIKKGPLLSLSDAHPQVVELRGLLYLFGDIDSSSVTLEPRELFDRQLHNALMRFQKRHGVKADGILGPKTRRLLNISPQQRVDQLTLNIHRQKQLPVKAGDYYLQVNIPEYRLRLYGEGEVLLDMKTIIGRRSRQTPTFSTEVKSLVVNPSWNVPRSIAFKDILPKWQRDKTYLARHNLSVIAGWTLPRITVPDEQIDLEKMYKGKEYYRLWEAPSKDNTLGQIKFQLNSGNSIYLHDTKKPYLFEPDMRAFSSGCIRLEKPRVLAYALLQQSNQWPTQQLAPLFDDTQTYNIRLKTPIPLHITYWTAWLDEQGILNFADDVYFRDPVDFAQIKTQQKQVALQLN